MIHVGVDIAKRAHWMAAIDDQGQVRLKPVRFTQDAEGYRQVAEILRSLGEPDGLVIGIEAIGHYWMLVTEALTRLEVPGASVQLDPEWRGYEVDGSRSQIGRRRCPAHRNSCSRWKLRSDTIATCFPIPGQTIGEISTEDGIAIGKFHEAIAEITRSRVSGV